MVGEEKDTITVWLTLGQRTLRYETYVMPAPEENIAAVNDMLLRRNASLVGAHFAIGVEDAIYLRASCPIAAVNAQELDRVLGTVYTAVEPSFRRARAARLRVALRRIARRRHERCLAPFVTFRFARRRCPHGGARAAYRGSRKPLPARAPRARRPGREPTGN